MTTRPSILCVTQKRAFMPLYIVLGQQSACMPVYTRSSWLNCALRDDEAVYWVSIGHYEAVAVGN